MFCVIAVHFFLLVGGSRRIHTPFWALLLYLPPVCLTVVSLAGPSTPAATAFTPSLVGWGWAYVSGVTPSLAAYLLYLGVYIVLGLAFLTRWAKESGRPRFIKQARGLVALDTTVLSLGLFTDVVLPLSGPAVPPLGNLWVIVWMVGFLYLIRNLKLITLHDAANADLILDTVMGPVLLLDQKGRIVRCNQATGQLLGRQPAELQGRRLAEFYRSGTYDESKVEHLFANKKLGPVDLELVAFDGRIIQVLAAFSVAESPLDGVVGIVASLNDVTTLKRVERELEALANADKLTGLPNRRRFFQDAEGALARYRSDGVPFALVFTDLDGFKALNDRQGHDIGDQLLVAVGNRLRQFLTAADLVARVGGDEFVLLCTRPGSREEFATRLEILKQSFSQPTMVGTVPCPVGLSAGIAWCPDDGTDTDQLMRIADQRMYDDKRARKGSVEATEHFRRNSARGQAGTN